jgi:hypothetical protein
VTPRLLESVDRRVLGGFVFVDGITSESVERPLTVNSGALVVRGNRSGVYAIFDGPGFRALTNQFTPVLPWPPPQNFEITVTDPTRRYLARRAQIQAPQVLTGAAAPQQVRLYPSAGSTVEVNWAVVRASVRSGAGAALPFSVVRVLLASDSSVMATGVADERGEALLAVRGMGLQVSSSATDPVTDQTTPVTIQAWFDPSVLTRPLGWIPNPDDILENLANPALKTGTQAEALGARQTIFASITISV